MIDKNLQWNELRKLYQTGSDGLHFCKILRSWRRKKSWPCITGNWWSSLRESDSI